MKGGPAKSDLRHLYMVAWLLEIAIESFLNLKILWGSMNFNILLRFSVLNKASPRHSEKKKTEWSHPKHLWS